MICIFQVLRLARAVTRFLPSAPGPGRRRRLPEGAGAGLLNGRAEESFPGELRCERVRSGEEGPTPLKGPA